MADWKKIKAEYIRTGASYRELADKYGVSFSTIQKRGADEKWTEKRKLVGRRSEELLAEKIADSSAKREVKRLDTFNDVADLLMEKIKAGIMDESMTKTSKDIRAITASLKDLKEIMGYKSDLDREEQMARIEKLRKEAERDDRQQDAEIRIIIDDEFKEYAE